MTGSTYVSPSYLNRYNVVNEMIFPTETSSSPNPITRRFVEALPALLQVLGAVASAATQRNQPAINQQGIGNNVTIIHNEVARGPRHREEGREERMGGVAAALMGVVGFFGFLVGAGVLGNIYRTVSDARASNALLREDERHQNPLEIGINAPIRRNLVHINSNIIRVGLTKGALIMTGIASAATAVVAGLQKSIRLRNVSVIVSMLALGAGLFCYTAGVFNLAKTCKPYFGRIQELLPVESSGAAQSETVPVGREAPKASAPSQDPADESADDDDVEQYYAVFE